MGSFERVKNWLARALEISEEMITPQSTLGDLIPSAEPDNPAGLNWPLVLAFEKEFPEANGEFLTQSMTVREVVELVDHSRGGRRSTFASRPVRQSGGSQETPARMPTIRVFEYIPELDAFLITREFRRLAAYLGLIEWHAAVWIGRLFMLDQDYGEHWFDNWDEREAVEEKARELGLESYDLMIINPERLASEQAGPCHPPELRKLFWTDVLKSLELSYELLFEEARLMNAKMKQFEERIRETNPSWKDSIDDLEERIRHVREGREIPSEEYEQP